MDLPRHSFLIAFLTVAVFLLPGRMAAQEAVSLAEVAGGCEAHVAWDGFSPFLKVETPRGAVTLSFDVNLVVIEGMLYGFSMPVTVRQGALVIGEDMAAFLQEKLCPLAVSSGYSPSPGENPLSLETAADPAPSALPEHPLSLRTVVLDPAGGGKDLGLTVGGEVEKTWTSALAVALREELIRRLGVTVILTREGDKEMTPEERVEAANVQRGDLYLGLSLDQGMGYPVPGVKVGLYDDWGADPEQVEVGPALWLGHWRAYRDKNDRFGNLLSAALQSGSSPIMTVTEHWRFRGMGGLRMPAAVVVVGVAPGTGALPRIPALAAALADGVGRFGVME